MITEIAVDCKDYVKSIGPKKDGAIAKKWFTSVHYPNPNCGAVGQFRHHGYYDRHILSVEQGHWVWNEIKILRGLCQSCETTHAFLPADIIPYHSVLISSFLAALLITFFQNNNCSGTEDLPEKESLSCYDEQIRTISIRGYYKLLNLFRAHMKYLEEIMRELEMWIWSQRLKEVSAIKLLLKSDLNAVQEKMLEVHRIPLFFKRKRTIAGFPFTGAQKSC